MNLFEYYANPAVRARLVEFLGGQTLEEATSVYLTSSDGLTLPDTPGQPVARLGQFLARSGEVARSLWDRRFLLAHLDLEYVNFDHPERSYEYPFHAFGTQHPVVDSIEENLLQFGIAPLHLLSGRGHHFVWSIARGSECFEEMAMLGRLTPSLRQLYRHPLPPHGEFVGEQLGAAYSGLGMVLEYLGQRVLAEASVRCSISVQLTAVEAGAVSMRGREVVSLDLSEYGDPLHDRTVRMPFGAYLKSRRCGNGTPTEPMVMIPHHEVNEATALEVMRNLPKAAGMARRASVQIPDQTAGSRRLLRAYRESSLCAFHDFFYSKAHEPPEQWSRTYDRVSLESLPPCIRKILEQPNDWLLKPAGIQLVVRSMLARGLHPRDISGLLLARFSRDYGWIKGVHFNDASCRADFYVRLFAGLIAEGLDEMIDMNCRSTGEKGYCVQACQDDPLISLRRLALSRRPSLYPDARRSSLTRTRPR